MEQHDIGGGVDLEHRMNGEQAAPSKPKVGRPRNADREPKPSSGLAFDSNFEANMFADEVEIAARAVEEANPDDGRTKRIVKLMRDKVAAIRTAHPS